MNVKLFVRSSVSWLTAPVISIRRLIMANNGLMMQSTSTFVGAHGLYSSGKRSRATVMIARLAIPGSTFASAISCLPALALGFGLLPL